MSIQSIRRLRRHTGKLLSDASGATGIEYALIFVVMAMAVIGAMQLLRDPVEAMFDQVNVELKKPL